jgi:hypothetical protein
VARHCVSLLFSSGSLDDSDRFVDGDQLGNADGAHLDPQALSRAANRTSSCVARYILVSSSTGKSQLPTLIITCRIVMKRIHRVRYFSCAHLARLPIRPTAAPTRRLHDALTVRPS